MVCPSLMDPRAILLHGYSSQEGRIIQRSDLHLQRTFRYLGLGYIFQDTIQQGGDIFTLFVLVVEPAVLAAAIKSWEIQLLVGGIQGKEQFEYRFVHFIRAAVGLVHLVDDYDRLQVQLKGLLQDETGLRHRAFEGIHQQQHTIGHFQHTFNLSTEIRVTGGIYYVDLGIFIHHSSILAENGDPSFPFEVVTIHDQLSRFLVVPEHMRSM